MDRNSIIGLLLIGAILIGYSIWVSPSQQELETARRKQDSVAAVEAERKARLAEEEIKISEPEKILDDTLRVALLEQQLGPFAGAAIGEEEKFILENELLRLVINSKGGRIATAELKDYQTYDSLPLLLFHENTSDFNLSFNHGAFPINTHELFFQPVDKAFSVSGKDSSTFRLRANAGEDRYIEYVYTLRGNSYLIDFDIRFSGLDNILAANRDLGLLWKIQAPNVEKSMENQRNNATVYYRFSADGDVDYLSETSNDQLRIDKSTHWIALKQQFFSAAIISEIGFGTANTEIKSFIDEASPEYVKTLSANISIPSDNFANGEFNMSMYLGPNHYQTLRKQQIGIEKIVPLGWGIFGWVNRFIVIPVFNFLSGFNMNYGIIILILTIFIKLILFPFTYKAYLSTAKMRLLKPELDELNKKHEKDDPLKKQQAVMALYKKAGVNPLGGCLPMLLQLPILIALFRFFPASIELRQESFLWAEDLSSYDSIYNLPFDIPFYGDHVSLFTILMTISTIIYTRMNSQLSASPEMAQMKWMMYLMPIIFLGVFNNYAAALSYYYFLANIITFGQQYAMQKMVNEHDLREKIEENKKRPASQKKSAFQKRLEEAAKKRGYKMP
jgi:YidC/Oxa1 family membrane protein insertase